jgi:hypothetical protein
VLAKGFGPAKVVTIHYTASDIGDGVPGLHSVRTHRYLIVHQRLIHLASTKPCLPTASAATPTSDRFRRSILLIFRDPASTPTYNLSPSAPATRRRPIPSRPVSPTTMETPNRFASDTPVTPGTTPFARQAWRDLPRTHQPGKTSYLPGNTRTPLSSTQDSKCPVRPEQPPVKPSSNPTNPTNVDRDANTGWIDENFLKPMQIRHRWHTAPIKRFTRTLPHRNIGDATNENTVRLAISNEFYQRAHVYQGTISEIHSRQNQYLTHHIPLSSQNHGGIAI